MMRARLALLSSFALSTSCIEEGTGYISVFVDPTQVVSEFVETDDGLALKITLKPSIDGDGNVLLDSALIVVNADGQTTSLADPEIEADGFPVAQFGETKVTLTVPSPIQEIDTFDAFCAANGRSADVTLRFFSDTIDPDTSVAPPVTDVVTNVPLTMTGAAPTPNVFSSSGVGSFSPGTTAPKVESLSAGPGDTVLFVIDRRATSNLDGSAPFAFFRADHDSVETLQGVTFYEDTPQVASNSDGSVLYLAGRVLDDTLEITSLDFSQQMQIQTNGAPEFDALRVARLSSTATGLRVIVQSAFQLEVDPEIVPAGVVDPPEGKYYGSFVFQLDDDFGFTVTSIDVAERDIISIIDMPDGGSLVTSTELPPRSEQTALRIERFDDAGALVWTHDEPVSAAQPDVLVFNDDSVLLSYEHIAPAGIIDVVRLSASDGAIPVSYTHLTLPTNREV